MTPTELVFEIEENWGKSLSPAQQRNYCRKLQRFTPGQLDRILNTVFEACQYCPRIANLYTAARDLGYLATEHKDGKTFGREGCPDCSETGWVNTTEPAVTVGGNQVDAGQAVRPCQCRRKG